MNARTLVRKWAAAKPRAITVLGVSNDSRTLAAGVGSNSIMLWRLPENDDAGKAVEKSVLLTFPAMPAIAGVAFSGMDRSLLVGTQAGQLVEVPGWSVLLNSPNGEATVGERDRTTLIASHSSPVTFIVCEPAGRLCATAARNSGQVAVVDVTQGPDEFEDPITQTGGRYSAPIAAMRYSAAADRLTIATHDGEAQIYTVKNLKAPVAAIPAKRSTWVRLLAVDASGAYAVLASGDALLALWDLAAKRPDYTSVSTAQLVAQACALLQTGAHMQSRTATGAARVMTHPSARTMTGDDAACR
jgi:WD40 repeat protein